MPNGGLHGGYEPDVSLSTRILSMENEIIRVREENEQLSNNIVELNKIIIKLQKALSSKIITELK